MAEAPLPDSRPPKPGSLATGAYFLAALSFCSMGLTAVLGLLFGLLALVRSVRHPALERRHRAIGAIAANLLVLGMCAIALSSLLKGKPAALEAATIHDLRSVVAGEAAYADQNRGLFEPRLECLAQPATCLEDYPKDGPPFLLASIASLQDKAGYHRAFHAGPPPPGSDDKTGGVTSFAYTAEPYAYDGMRAFCADSTATICFRRDGRAPGITPTGLCDLSTCEKLD